MNETSHRFTRLDDATLEREVRAMQAAFVREHIRRGLRWLRARLASNATLAPGSRAA